MKTLFLTEKIIKLRASIGQSFCRLISLLVGPFRQILQQTILPQSTYQIKLQRKTEKKHLYVGGFCLSIYGPFG